MAETRRGKPGEPGKDAEGTTGGAGGVGGAGGSGAETGGPGGTGGEGGEAGGIERRARGAARRDVILVGALTLAVAVVGWIRIGGVTETNCDAILQLRDVQIENAKAERDEGLAQLNRFERRRDGEIIPGISNNELRENEKQEFQRFRAALLMANCDA
jgi:hypothetical protein